MENSKILKSEVVTMTPEWAKNLIENNNSDNRKVRQSVVKKYAIQMKEGNWKLTHQGIAIDETGKLVDGQHRLMAIIETGISIPILLVVFQGRKKTLMEPIDNGQKRNTTDITGIPKKDVQIVKTWIRVFFPFSAKATDPYFIKKIYEQTSNYINRINTSSGASKAIVGMAPVRSAFCYGLLVGNNYANEYEIFASTDFGTNKIRTIREWVFDFNDGHSGGAVYSKFIFGGIVAMLENSILSYIPDETAMELSVIKARDNFKQLVEL